jgi:hypothetical protein
MIILLPTYKRTKVLKYVINSILDNEVIHINERVLILIVNNNFSQKNEIQGIINTVTYDTPFSIIVVHQEKLIVAVESWFGEIFKYAFENEIIVMHGDDDLMLPNKLKKSYDAVKSSNADMIITDYYQRLYFSKNTRKYLFIGDKLDIENASELKIVDFNFTPEHSLPASFISSHIYVNSEAMRKGYSQALEWCKTQSWAPWEFASGLLPTWMSFAIHKQGGKVCKLNYKTVVRGQLISELLEQEYADGGSTVFYSLLYYQLFKNNKIHENKNILIQNRDICLDSIKSRSLDLLLNKTISKNNKNDAMHHAGITWLELIMSRKFIFGSVKFLISKISILKGARVRLTSILYSQPTNELKHFLRSL